MSYVRPRVLVLAATAITTLALGAGPASAAPACSDRVANTLHTVHETTGDPGGLAHTVEDAYCDAKP